MQDLPAIARPSTPGRTAPSASAGPRDGARLLALPAGPLPAWCDRHLADAASGAFFASRAWYDTLLAHALPPDAEPVLALAGAEAALLLPLMRQGGRLAALASPYTLDWRPLAAPDAAEPTLRAAGRDLGGVLRGARPVRLDCLDPAAPGLAPMLEGLRDAGLVPVRFDHTGNWRQPLAPGAGWDGYLAARPPALRTTIGRKLARAARDAVLEIVAAPGPALEAGIAAYAAVRARSWKPHEPFPDFDGHLMRVAAGLGVLRLGVLRLRADGQPVAAQYWVLDQGGRRATVLKLAHDEAARAASPGTVLTAVMIRSLIEADGVGELDFGRGDDPYKALWATDRRQRIGVLIADPRHPSGVVALARHLAGRMRRRLPGWVRRPRGGSDP
jgi:CelD/BcsL family acetyltransferase involved in cellulose biosynthesis